MPDASPESPPLKDYQLMLARQATDDVSSAQPVGCMICPCVDRKWYIVTVCPCAGYLCDKCPYEFIGSMIPAGETPPYFVQASYAGRSTHFQVYDILYEAPIDWSTTGGHVGNQEFWVVVAPLNSIIWAVRHTTAPAPFASTVESRVIIDGEYAGDWNGEAATNEEVAIGDSVVPGISAQVDCILVDHAFTESGFHTVDLKVVFTGKNGEGTTGYTVRHIIRVGPKSGTLNWLNQVGIVPEEYVFDDCGSLCLRVSDEEVSRVAAYTSVLKGPFDSRADALEVLTTWNGLINAYAKTCVCEVGCWYADLLADGIDELDGKFVLTRFASGLDMGAGYFCDEGWARYDVSSANDNFQDEFPDWSITPWLYDERDGSWTQAGVKGVIEPCQNLLFVVTGEGVSAIGFDLDIDIGLGTVEPLSPPSPCCLEDEESIYYEAAWDYDSGTHEGVPGNSEELADYLESLAI